MMRTKGLDSPVGQSGAIGPEAKRTLSFESAAERSYEIRPNAKKTALAIGSTLVAINMWTGAPLFALWVASQLVSSISLTMGAFVIVVVVLALVEVLLTLLLTWIHATYDELTGRPMEARRTSPWLRSMRGEREEVRRTQVPSSPLEKAVMLTVVVAILAFEVWLFFFAHYMYPGGNV
jgi:hypothetical protein